MLKMNTRLVKTYYSGTRELLKPIAWDSETSETTSWNITPATFSRDELYDLVLAAISELAGDPDETARVMKVLERLRLVSDCDEVAAESEGA